MGGKGSKRIKKREAAMYRKSGQKAIDDLKLWIVLSPRPMAIMHIQTLIESTYGVRPPADDIEIRVVPDLLQTDSEAIVVNVAELRKASGLDDITDPLSVLPSHFPMPGREMYAPQMPLTMPKIGGATNV